MVESVKVKAEGSVFSIKKSIILSDLNPGFKLLSGSFFVMLGLQIVEGKRGQPHFLLIYPGKRLEKWG
jgi:hypothetical protein